MQKLHILVEGQTEEVIVNNVIGPYLSNEDLYVTTSILKTKQPAGGRPAHSGGVTNWTKIFREIRLLLGDTSTTLLTTLIDYYGFPDNAPGMADRPVGSPYARVEHVENALAQAVGNSRFLPHLVLHEIEAWVLTDCSRLADLLGNSSEAAQLARVVMAESGPEMVDDGIETAPSKRIIGLYPRYAKTFDGPLVIADIGLDEIRRQCPHANRWLSAIESALKPAIEIRPTTEGQDPQLPGESCTDPDAGAGDTLGVRLADGYFLGSGLLESQGPSRRRQAYGSDLAQGMGYLAEHLQQAARARTGASVWSQPCRRFQRGTHVFGVLYYF